MKRRESIVTIAWDVDDVLNHLMRDWFEKHWLPSHTDCSVCYSELTENPPHKILGISLSDYLNSLDTFRLSTQYLEMAPVSEVMQWFHQQGAHFRHIALTAVPLRAAHSSAAWTMREFGKWIRAYHVIPSQRPNETLPLYDSSKQETLKRLGQVDVFIDDNESNLTGLREMGVQKFIFPRPWNTSQKSVAEMLESLTELVSRLNLLNKGKS